MPISALRSSATLQHAREHALPHVRTQLGDRDFAALSGEGWCLTCEQAIGLACTPEVASREPGGLSSREREVARLVARGLSNRDIAQVLVLTERTVESHLTHNFGKLDLRSRSQLTAWVLEHLS